ncbi:MAG: 2OG-Fe(II) oxygenase, partial [Bdellovibrionales bacterium]|nr:2OG-Fe(II) oxygenase [Bdellovibrionales bacterium]
ALESGLKLGFSFKDLVSAPYPHVVSESVLPKEYYSALKNEFPAHSVFEQIRPVMGNRRRIASDEPHFYEFLSSAPSWKRLFEYVNSSDFIQSMFDIFGEEFSRNGSSFSPASPWRLDRDYFQRRSEKSGFIARSLSRLEDKYFSKNDVQELYVHFDISSAHNGYTREIHADNRNRLIALLIYFSGAEDVGGTGGSLGIHKHKVNKSLKDYERFPDDEDCEMAKEIPPANNRAVAFLCSNNSYHSVPLIQHASGWRNFIYVGISAKTRNAWN